MNKIITMALFWGLVLVSSNFAQPKIILQVYGGYSLPLPDLRGDIPLKTGDNNYQMKNGFNFGADGKYAFEKSGKFRVTASLNYNMFTNSGDMELVENGVEIHKINIFTAGIGLEYSFLPKNNINPFIGAEITGNFFNGKIKTEIGDTLGSENSLKSESRFGLLFNGGVDIVSSKNIGIVVGVKYNLANLFGKDSSSVSDNEYALWDKEYVYNGNTIPAKNIQFLQLYAGVSFYLLQPKRTVKK